MSNENKPSLAFLIRHSERADFVDSPTERNKIEDYDDVPITTKGV